MRTLKVVAVGNGGPMASRLFDEAQRVLQTRFEVLDELSSPFFQRRGNPSLLLTVCRSDDELKKVESLGSDIPIIVLTDSDDETFAVKALQLGAQDCLSLRQLDSKSLVRSLRHAVERHRRLLELKQAHRREQYLATHDGLTDLPNRRLFFDRLSHAMAFANRYGEVVAVLFLDLDGLKRINDRMGHEAGDELLQAVAGRFKQSVRQSDTVARYGGDEFAFIFRRVSGRTVLGKVVEKLRERLSKPLFLAGREVRVTASIGISIYSRGTETARELVQRADEAMYASKKMGGDSHQFWRPDLAQEESRPLEPTFVTLSPHLAY